MELKVGDHVVVFTKTGRILETTKITKLEKDDSEDGAYYINCNGGIDGCYFHPDCGDYAIPKELLETEIGQLIWQ